MFNLLLVLIPAIACIARDPSEGKERVHSFEVKYNRARRREKRQIFPESFLPGPNSPGELSAVPVEKLPAAEAILVPQTPDQRLPIVEGFPVAERIQEEKMEQVADIDVLPESDRMMSDRMRQGRERLLWADDAMVAGIKKTDLDPERVMEGRITDNVDIESVKAMDHWEPDSYPLEASRVVGEEEKGPNEVKLMQEDNLEEGNLEASAVKEEPKLRWGPEIEEKSKEEESLAKSSLKLDTTLAIKGGNDSSSGTELSGGEKTVKEEEEEDEQGEDEDKKQIGQEEKVEEEEKVEGEKAQLDDIKKSLEKVDKKLFLIGSLLDKKFKEVLAKLQNDTESSREESTTKNGSSSSKEVIRKIDPTLVKLAKLAKNDSSTEDPTIKLNPKLGPKRVEVGKSAAGKE